MFTFIAATQTGVSLFEDGHPNIIAVIVLALGLGLSYLMTRR